MKLGEFIQRRIDIARYSHVEEMTLSVWYLREESLGDDRREGGGGDEDNGRCSQGLRELILIVHCRKVLLFSEGYGTLSGAVIDAYLGMV